MGMIAFYAGLFVGILFGLLFSSLWAFSLARHEAGARPDRAEELSPADLTEPGPSPPRLDPVVPLSMPPWQQPVV
jgi:hypothetical protein